MNNGISFSYMETVIAERSLLVSEDEALAGAGLLSLETAPELTGDVSVVAFAREEPLLFLKALRWLGPEDQQLLISYYLLSKTQDQLGRMHHRTQTLTSVRIREAVQRMGAYLLLGGAPTGELMKEVLTRHSVEDSFSTPLSKLFLHYLECRSYAEVAKFRELKRAVVRRVMRKVADQLRTAPDFRDQALGHILYGLQEKADISGNGLTQREQNKQGHIYRRDSELLGQFRVDAQHPEFDQVFTPRANLGWGSFAV